MDSQQPSAWTKLFRLSWADRILLANAVISLGIARVLIVALRFRQVAKLASKAVPPSSPNNAEALISKIRWAVQAGATRVPWRALCFEQGLAAHMMLRRRGVNTVLFYGAAPNLDEKLAAHVWVRYGSADVIGGESASQFAVLATFPPQ
jgi:hypothetical protein